LADAVAYLPDDGLVIWGRGDQLTADGLNGNFATLRGYAEQALMRALTPDPAAVARLEEACEAIQAMHEDQHRRLARLEQQPEAATAEDLKRLRSAHRKSARQAALALGQAIGLRQEVSHYRTLAEGHDRLANRLEFAPLATVAHLLERLMRLEEAQKP
jgi:hypothetical protein